MKEEITYKKMSLNELYKSYQNGIRSAKSVAPRKILESWGLDYNKSEFGYVSGQGHHGKSKEELQPLVDLGVLIHSNAPVNKEGLIPYTTVGKEGITLPLKNEIGDIVSYYAYRYKLSTPKVEYLNDMGVFPKYPKSTTTKLFLFQSEIDCATYQQSELLSKGDGVLALRNGLLSVDIVKAINSISDLKQIVIVGEVKAELRAQFSNHNLPLATEIPLPDSHTLNDMWVNYGADAIESHFDEVLSNVTTPNASLTVVSESEFTFIGKELRYRITGELPSSFGFVKLHFKISSEYFNDVFRGDLELTNSNEVEQSIYDWSEKVNVNYGQTIIEINQITDELQKFIKNNKQGKPVESNGYSSTTIGRANKILNSSNPIEKINKLIGDMGVVGEEQTRLLLFLIACSYKFKYNLHAVIDEKEDDLGFNLINQIGNLIPTHESYDLDVTSSKTFRYYGNSAVNHKLLIIPDYTGVTGSKSIHDLKRLQARSVIVSDVPKKGSEGFLYTEKQTVHGHNSSIGACRFSKKYFENEPKTVIVGLDTTDEHITNLMHYECKKVMGVIDEVKEQKAIELLRCIAEQLKSFEVVNPFADKLMLPIEIPNVITLTKQLLAFVNIIALFHQKKRKFNDGNKLIVEQSDIELAVELFADTIMHQIDDVDTNSRDFFEKLKTMALNTKEGRKAKLSSLDIREALNMKKTTLNRYLDVLVKAEFVERSGHKNRGFDYQIKHWNDLMVIKKIILDKIKK